MNNFEFYNPVKVIFGAGEVRRVGGEACQYGKHALIVSYADASFFGDLFQRIHDSLAQSGVSYTDCMVATANPKLSEARQAIEIGKQAKADMVIGVGGGSAMDLAKVTAAGMVYPHPLEKMIRFSHSEDIQIPPKAALPILMIPTLPATASEMNPTAVITDDDTRRKAMYGSQPVCIPRCRYWIRSLPLHCQNTRRPVARWMPSAMWWSPSSLATKPPMAILTYRIICKSA